MYIYNFNILRSKDKADEEKEVEEDGQPPVAPVAGADPMDHEERCQEMNSLHSKVGIFYIGSETSL